MFDIGWTEMLVVACVAIIVVGPKDLPKMLRSVGKTIRKVRGMASDFQRQFNDALKETELDDLKKDFTDSQTFAPIADAKKAMEDFKKNVDDSVFDVEKDISDDTVIAKADVSAKSGAKKPVRKPAAKSTAKAKTVAKKTAAAKPAAKKSVARKPATRKPVAKAAAAKPAAKKPVAKKPATPAKTAAAKDSVGQRTKSSSVRKPGASRTKSRDATA
ncbi:MAG: twin-arginine translocase subunit TatB [Rhizobiaceae bacterium]|nr:twin-arginine translocase subunit TatB [Rhizobiaceae bacterium]MBL4695153.1 twin-arginine translocase subunit TatB [Rhizobiaceae bacterium]